MRALPLLLLCGVAACDPPAPPTPPAPPPATPDAALLAPSGPLAALDRAPGPPALLVLDDPLTPLLAWLKEPATVAALEGPALRDWLAATGLEPGLLDPAVLSLGLVAQRDVVPDRVVVRGDGAARPAFAQALAALRGGVVEAPRLPRLTAHLRFRTVEGASAAETWVRTAFGESARFEGRLRDVLGERLDAVPHAETRAALAALPVTLHVERDGPWLTVALGPPLPREGEPDLGFAARWAPGGPAARLTSEADGVRLAVRGLDAAPAALRRALPADADIAWAWPAASPRGAVEMFATLLGPWGAPAAALAEALPADAVGVAVVVRHPTTYASLEATVVRKGERAEVRLPGLPVPQVALVWPGDLQAARAALAAGLGAAAGEGGPIPWDAVDLGLGRPTFAPDLSAAAARRDLTVARWALANDARPHLVALDGAVALSTHPALTRRLLAGEGAAPRFDGVGLAGVLRALSAWGPGLMGQLTGSPDGEAGQGALLRGLAGVAVALGAVDVAGDGANVTLRRRPGVAPDAAAVGAWLDAFCAGGGMGPSGQPGARLPEVAAPVAVAPRPVPVVVAADAVRSAAGAAPIPSGADDARGLGRVEGLVRATPGVEQGVTLYADAATPAWLVARVLSAAPSAVVAVRRGGPEGRPDAPDPIHAQRVRAALEAAGPAGRSGAALAALIDALGDCAAAGAAFKALGEAPAGERCTTLAEKLKGALPACAPPAAARTLSVMRATEPAGAPVVTVAPPTTVLTDATPWGAVLSAPPAAAPR